jgi:hypothetical protein
VFFHVSILIVVNLHIEEPGVLFFIRKTGKSGFDLTALVRIGVQRIAPAPVVRILGLWLDSSLRWKADIEAVHGKV